MSALRVWLIHRLGGVEKYPTLKDVETCLKRTYSGMTPWVGSITSTTSMGSDPHLECRCSRCRSDAFESGRRTVRRHGESLRRLAAND